jgi:hypothetical protein
MDKVTMSSEYDTNSSIQREIITNNLKLILEVVDLIVNENPNRFNNISQSFTIADLGCASGTNSLIFLTPIIDKIRTFKADLPIVIYLNDLPINDFSTAMINVKQGLLSYKNIFIYSTGGSFVNSLFPNNSIDLFICINSIHWLEKAPAESNSLFYFLDEETEKTEEGKLWAEESRKELFLFMKHRMNELRQSGKLIIELGVINYYQFKGKNELKIFFSMLCESFKKILRRENINFNPVDISIPGCVRAEKHVMEVLEDNAFSELKLLSPFEMGFYTPPFKELLEDNVIDSSIQLFVKTQKAVTYEFYKNSLFRLGVPSDKVEIILNELYDVELPKTLKENREILKAIPGLNNTIMLIGKETITFNKI